MVVRNPELCPKVLQMLHQHAIRMGLNNAADSVCPIDVHDLVKEQDDQAIVKVGTFTTIGVFRFTKISLFKGVVHTI